MATYTVHFTRVGRHDHVPELTVKAASSDILYAHILAHVKPLLASKAVEVDMNHIGGHIYAGDRHAGDFDIKEQP